MVAMKSRDWTLLVLPILLQLLRRELDGRRNGSSMSERDALSASGRLECGRGSNPRGHELSTTELIAEMIKTRSGRKIVTINAVD